MIQLRKTNGTLIPMPGDVRFIEITDLGGKVGHVIILRDNGAIQMINPKDDPELVPLSRFREVAPEMPVVALLADRHQAKALDVLQRGAADYLLKSQISEDALPPFLLRAVERNARDKAVRESEERFRVMIENASDVLLMVNPRWCSSPRPCRTA